MPRSAPPPAPAPTAALGWPIVALVLLYLFAGLVGREPWKGDDAVNFGIAWWMLTHGEWLVPALAGEPQLAVPPLHAWLGAISGMVFGWLLDAPDAVRLATAASTAVILAATVATARALDGKGVAAAALLLVLGSIGLVAHTHEIQPQTTLVAGQVIALAGLAALPQRRLAGVAMLAAGIAIACLAGGVHGLLVTAPLCILLPLLSVAWRSPVTLGGLVSGLLLGASAAAIWPAMLLARSPELYEAWRSLTAAQLVIRPDWPGNFVRQFALFAWSGWPALPVAVWTLWSRRRQLTEGTVVLPLAALLLAFAVAGGLEQPKTASTMTLMVPTALLATAGLASLRRGAANALDWFGVMTFTLLAALLWLGWVAMVFGVPARLAANVTRLEPGFVGRLSLWIVPALLLTLGWFWAVPRVARGPRRPAMHWAMGMTLFWALTAWLWFPWIEHGKSYRSVAESLHVSLPTQFRCVARHGVGASERAVFHYFLGLTTRPTSHPDVAECDLLLVQIRRSEETDVGRGWKPIWTGQRAGDRQSAFRLYQRTSARARPPEGPDPADEEERPGPLVPEPPAVTDHP